MKGNKDGWINVHLYSLVVVFKDSKEDVKVWDLRILAKDVSWVFMWIHSEAIPDVIHVSVHLLQSNFSTRNSDFGSCQFLEDLY